MFYPEETLIAEGRTGMIVFLPDLMWNSNSSIFLEALAYYHRSCRGILTFSSWKSASG